MQPIYLDHNATTPLLPRVLDAMLPWLKDGFGNPSSGHRYGLRARDAVEEARARVAGLIGAQADEIVFTSGGTESNNLAIRGVADAQPLRSRFVTTTIEHPATSGPLERLETRGATVFRVPVDGSGRVSADAVLAAATGATALITVMLANNETGVLQPIAEIGARRGGLLLHTDAAQAVGKIPIAVDTLGVDLLTIAGHKLYAPKGVGALYVRRGTPIRPVLLGAGQERGLRPGTENVPYIVGLGVACTLAADHARAASDLHARTERLWERLALAIPGLARHGSPTERLPNTLNLGFPGVTGSAVLAQARDVAASTGSACHDHGESPSATLLAMGIPHDRALGAVRLSLGVHTTDADIDRAAASLIAGWRAAREAA